MITAMEPFRYRANDGIKMNVLDGWWPEAYDDENGWAITPHPELPAHVRDEREAGELLDLIEEQVVPLLYARNAAGEPDAWVKKSKASMKTILPRYNGIRMCMDYPRELNAPAIQHCDALARGNETRASQLAA
jgi:starch phosphorylase